MKKTVFILKALLYGITGAICAEYVVRYCLSVTDMVVRHTDEQYFLPFAVGVFSLLLAAALLIFHKVRPIDRKLFFIPLAYFLSAAVTLIVADGTHCPYCG
ncbi:MAG: hypothetical protein IKU13_07070 [Clostridia bacterium]|nr:hypothetical protein [Clostridia bacterium]